MLEGGKSFYQCFRSSKPRAYYVQPLQRPVFGACCVQGLQFSVLPKQQILCMLRAGPAALRPVLVALQLLVLLEHRYCACCMQALQLLVLPEQQILCMLCAGPAALRPVLVAPQLLVLLGHRYYACCVQALQHLMLPEQQALKACACCPTAFSIAFRATCPAHVACRPCSIWEGGVACAFLE
eukprot:scaffold9461_cov20-Tisochrysis_lutea.AAC.1